MKIILILNFWEKGKTNFLDACQGKVKLCRFIVPKLFFFSNAIILLKLTKYQFHLDQIIIENRDAAKSIYGQSSFKTFLKFQVNYLSTKFIKHPKVNARLGDPAEAEVKHKFVQLNMA